MDNEQVERLKEQCYAGTSNADMAKEFGVELLEIYANRSALGIAIPKCKLGKQEGQRTELEVMEEMEQIWMAQEDAGHKIECGDARLIELQVELLNITRKRR